MARVAIIDDSRLMRNVVRRFLENGGHTVLEWEPSSAMEVLEWARDQDPDLLITDFQMPGANGATVTRMAKKGKPTLPVICLTALRDPEVLELLQKAQVTAILGKPCTQDEFLAAVDKALGGGGSETPTT